MAGVNGSPFGIQRLANDEWSGFILRQGQEYQVYHASLREFLLGQSKSISEPNSDLEREMFDRARATMPELSLISMRYAAASELFGGGRFTLGTNH